MKGKLMKTIHIIQSQHSQDLKQLLLETNNGLLFTEVLPFNIAFSLDQDSAQLLVESYRIIKALQLKVLQDSAQNPTNIESYLQFIQEMKLYGLSVDDLPSSTSLQEDNKLIISSLFSLVKDPIIDPNTTYIAYDHFLSHAQLVFLTKHNIEVKELPSTEATINYQKTLNIRHEFESVIQDIITKKLDDVSIVVPSLQENLPLIESVMNRYGFNVTLQDRSSLSLRKKYITLYNFLSSPTQAGLIQCLNHHVFNLKTNKDLIYLIELFNLNHELPESLDSQHPDITKIITRSLEDYQTLKDLLDSVGEDKGFHVVSIEAYRLLNNGINDLKPLRNFIEQYHYHFDDETQNLYLYQLEKMSSSQLSIEHFNFYDFNDFNLSIQDQVYAVDLSSRNFPAISSHTGVLDESYRAEVKNYPSLQERTSHTLNNKYTFLRRSKNLTLSYAYTNYEGKGLEPSFELFAKAKSIPMGKVVQNINSHKLPYKMSEPLVKDLFMPNGKIKTSVSALETYQKDPLKFFIEHGLRFREPKRPIFGPLELGTINHDTIENFHKGIQEESQLWNTYPHNIRLQMIQDRNHKNLELDFKYIKDAIDASSLKPELFEYEFSDDHRFAHFDIKGKIDRVDIDEESGKFIIYDYKSSSTSLSEKSIQRGEQLQLLTYAYILDEIFKPKNLHFMGVYYFSLRGTDILSNTFKYTRTKGIEPIEQATMEAWIKSREFKGMLFDFNNGIFTDHQYHQRLSYKSKTDSVDLHGKPFNKQTTLNVLMEVYQRYYESIKSGTFEPYFVKQNLKPDYFVKLQKGDDE